MSIYYDESMNKVSRKVSILLKNKAFARPASDSFPTAAFSGKPFRRVLGFFCQSDYIRVVVFLSNCQTSENPLTN